MTSLVFIGPFFNMSHS